MSWITELDKHGYNILIDELVWLIEQGRKPSLIKIIKDSKRTGYEFWFSEKESSFLNVNNESIEMNWIEAKKIVSKFNQLEGVSFVGT